MEEIDDIFTSGFDKGYGCGIEYCRKIICDIYYNQNFDNINDFFSEILKKINE